MSAEIAAACIVCGALCLLLALGGWLSEKIPTCWVQRLEGAKKQPARVQDGQAAEKKSSTP